MEDSIRLNSEGPVIVSSPSFLIFFGGRGEGSTLIPCLLVVAGPVIEDGTMGVAVDPGAVVRPFWSERGFVGITIRRGGVLFPTGALCCWTLFCVDVLGMLTLAGIPFGGLVSCDGLTVGVEGTSDCSNREKRTLDTNGDKENGPTANPDEVLNILHLFT